MARVQDWRNHCLCAVSPGTAEGLDSPCPWLPQLLLPTEWDVAGLEQALALALLQHPLKNFKACFMAGRSGLKPFSLPGDFNEKVIILLIFVDTLCKSCHGSRRHTSPGREVGGLGWGRRKARLLPSPARARRGHGDMAVPRDLPGCRHLCSPGRSPAWWARPVPPHSCFSSLLL